MDTPSTGEVSLDVAMNNLSFQNGTPESGPYFVDYFETHPTLIYALLVFLSFGTVFGTTGNLMIMASVVLDKQLRTAANVFVVNLALADLGISAIVNPFAIAGLLRGGQLLVVDYPGLCEVVSVVCWQCCCGSLWSMMVISVNRVVAIAYSHKYKAIFTVRNCVLMAALTWPCVYLLQIPSFFGWGGNRFDTKSMACVFDRSVVSFSITTAAVNITLPCVVICVSYTKVFLAVLASKKKVAAGIRDKITGSMNMKREVRLAKTLFAIFIVFCVCWMPFGFLILIDYNDNASKEVHALLLQLAHANSSGVNFVIYYMIHPRFHRDFLMLLKCHIAAINSRHDQAFSGSVQRTNAKIGSMISAVEGIKTVQKY